MEVADTYEAAYYLLQGARLVSARRKYIPLHEQSQYMYTTRWYITMEDIPDDARKVWHSQQATAKVRELAKARKRVKRFVMNYIKKLP